MKLTVFKKSVLAMSMAVSLIALEGCSVIESHKADKRINSDDGLVSEKIRQGNKLTGSSTSAAVVDGLYIAGKSYKISERDRLPDIFLKNVSVAKTDPMTFPEIVNLLSFDFNMKISLTPDAFDFLNGKTGSSKGNQKQESSDDSTGEYDEMQMMAQIMNADGAGFPGESLKFALTSYRGSIAGLLDSVSSMANLSWKWDGEQVVISRLETAHYVFDGDAISDSFEATISTARSGGGSSDGESPVQEGSQTAQTTRITRKAGDAFADLEKAISAMVSSEGKFSISPLQGVVTVTDTPLVQKKVARYIEQINNIVNKRINVRTEVYEIASDNSGNFNIDFNALYSGSARYGVELLNATSDAMAPNVQVGIISGNSDWNGSKALINSLNSVADMSLLTSSTNFTTNGKTVPVQVADERAYIKQVSKTQTDEGVTFTAETATIVSGYTMNLTPRINSNGDVDLQFAVDMSQLKDLETKTIGDDQIIQLPNRSFKNFEQRVSVDSGSTIMLAGFERTINSSSSRSVYGKPLWFLGGGKGGGKQKVMTLILITPYIMAK